MRTDARGTAFHGFGHPAAKGCLLLQGFSLVPDNPLDTRRCILVAVHNGEAPMICATCHTVDDALTVEFDATLWFQEADPASIVHVAG